jgi:hypothetical protein
MAEHFGEEGELDGDDAAVDGECVSGLIEEQLVFAGPVCGGGWESVPGLSEAGEDGAGMWDIEEVNECCVKAFEHGDFEGVHQSCDGDGEVIANEEESLDVATVALSESADESGFGIRRIAAQPLFKLIEDDDNFAAGVLPEDVAGISGIRIVREVAGEGFKCVEEFEFGVLCGGIKNHGLDSASECGEQSSANEGRFPAAAGAINHSGGECLLGVSFFEFLFPEGDAFGESGAIAGSWEELEEEGCVFFSERAESSGGDWQSIVICGIRGNAASAIGFFEPGFEVIGEICGGLISIGGASSECFEADAFEFTGDAAAEVAERSGGGGDHLAEGFADGASSEGSMIG